MKNVLLALFCLIILQSFGQTEKVKVKFNDFDDIRDFRKAKDYLRVANDHFLYMSSNVNSRDKSLEGYLVVWELFSENALLNYRIGYLYQKRNEYSSSLKFLTKALELDSTVSDYIHLRLGKAYQMNYQFDLALSQYLKFRQHLKTFKTTDNVLLELLRYEANCRNAKNILKDTLEYSVRNLGQHINSDFDDYGGEIVNDTLYFNSQRIWNEKNVMYNGKGYVQIYSACMDKQPLDKARLYDKDMALSDLWSGLSLEKYDKSSDSFIVYYYGREATHNLLFAKFKNNKIHFVEPVLPNIENNIYPYSVCFDSSYTQTFLIGYETDDTQFFNLDVYYSKGINGAWESPMNIGPVINTQFSEASLFLSADGKTLYFSSQGHNSIGGYDIFKSELDKDGNWSKPINLGYPINTIYDDFYYWETKDGSKAIITSNRLGGYGGMDLYEVIK
jgi:tetratricopeptide (TPR) repeat protein